MTATQSLFEVRKLEAVQKILIHTASGGAGHCAVQMTKASGAYVIGTTSAKNREFVLRLGADQQESIKTDVVYEINSGDLELVHLGPNS